jgi:hypothetical protein
MKEQEYLIKSAEFNGNEYCHSFEYLLRIHRPWTPNYDDKRAGFLETTSSMILVMQKELHLLFC